MECPHAWDAQALRVPREAPSTGQGQWLAPRVLSVVGVPQCAMLNEKLDSLVRELNEEAQAIVVPEGMAQATPADTKDQEKGGSFNPSPVPRIFKSKEQLMLRANSLKKALRQIIEQAEKGEGVVGAGSSRGTAAAWHGLRSHHRLVLNPCLGFPVGILGVAAALCYPRALALL